MAVLDDIRHYWDQDAATYDHASDHTAKTGAERAAWTAALARALPPAPARVLDCGAGTGFLSLMAARPTARLERLPTVEWATRLSLHPLERALGVPPRFIVTAGS